jgi:hypothetical protein
LTNDNLNTTQTPEYTKDKYNVKIIKRKVSPKVSPTTYVGRRLEESKKQKGQMGNNNKNEMSMT